jgi:hypothetical protein
MRLENTRAIENPRRALPFHYPQSMAFCKTFKKD